MTSVTTEPLSEGFCFGEGPRWFEGLVWFSDMLGEAVHTVTLAGEMSTLPLPGHAPSGLGFRPDGSLLIVSATRREVLRYDGDTVQTIASLDDVVPADLGDMVVDAAGRAYVGSQAREGGVVVRVDPDGGVTVVADDLNFPNGMVLADGGHTLVVAESTARRLTAFTVDDAGGLGDRRVFADGLDGPPDGLAIDADGGVWTSLVLANRFVRVLDGGVVTDRIDIGDRIAIACALGGPEGRTLFMLSSTSAYPESLLGSKDSRLDAVMVDVPATGEL
jgi:sugar lactone lactonase YvrE